MAKTPPYQTFRTTMGRLFMLETLDDIPWSGLTHAYGSAADVPDEIRTLLSEDPEAVRGVLFTFTCNIFHQGTRYSATVFAIPFLIELLPHVPSETQAGVLDLLAHLALGFPDEPLTRADVLRLANPGETNDLEGRLYNPINRDCYGEVAAGFPTYVELLEASPIAGIAAGRVLAFLPEHAYNAGTALLAIAKQDRRDPLLRTSCLMALGFMRGANCAEEALLYCDALVAQDVEREGKTPALIAAAAFCLLAISAEDVSIDLEQIQRVADHALRQGIEVASSDHYQSRKIPDEIESSEDYYEAFLEPRPAFPWDIETALRRAKRARELASGEVVVSEEVLARRRIKQTLADFESATTAERALSLARTLLGEAFGEWNGITSCEYPHRVFKTETWTKRQRRVLQAIADCELVWPKIAYQLHGSLKLEFDPERQELRDALAGKQPSSAEKEQSAAEIDLSEASILAATRRLYESFAIERRDLKEELARFEPYRPHVAPALPFLIERLERGETLAERQSAAWAIGRMKEYGAPAAPALLGQLPKDPENQYAGYALSDIPLDEELLEQIFDLMESTPAHFDTLYRYAGPQVTVDRLRRWRQGARHLRRHALQRLAHLAFDEVRDELLQMVESNDEETVRFAWQCLATPAAIPWYVANMYDLTPERRIEFAQAFANPWGVDFGERREAIYSAIESTDDLPLATELLRVVARFRTWGPADVDRCRRLLSAFDTPSWKLDLIELLQQFAGPKDQASLTRALRLLLTHWSQYVRAAALDAIPREALSEELFAAASADVSPLVRRTVAWKLDERNDEDGDRRLQMLHAETDDRVAVDLVWNMAAHELLVSLGEEENPDLPCRDSLIESCWADFES